MINETKLMKQLIDYTKKLINPILLAYNTAHQNLFKSIVIFIDF